MKKSHHYCFHPDTAKAPRVPRLCGGTDNNKTLNPINNVYTLCFNTYHTYETYTLQVRQCDDDHQCTTVLKTENLDLSNVQVG